MVKVSFLLLMSLTISAFTSSPLNAQERESCGPVVGAERTNMYLPLLDGKRVGVVANQTSMVGDTHLVDTLLRSQVNVLKVFSPEHGFRGHAAAGEMVNDGRDEATGIPIVSLYGDNRKPKQESLADIEIMLFDLQDVGVRFYTYISTLHLVMEACAEAKVPLIVLDRPNPNGFYVDGPTLQPVYTSFVGMHPIPIVHGMTIGEYARMINGEHWLADGLICDLKVVLMENWTHDSLYELPVPPSPNLPSLTAIYLYPTLCLFEGTPISVGRGTSRPFTRIGHPSMPQKGFSFTPVSTPNAAPNPKLQDQKCYGIDFTDSIDQVTTHGHLMLEWIIYAYNNYPDTASFFQSFFDKLSGTDMLKSQIKKGLSADQIRASWEPDLKAFLKVRKKYLLYTDSDRLRHPECYH